MVQLILSIAVLILAGSNVALAYAIWTYNKRVEVLLQWCGVKGGSDPHLEPPQNREETGAGATDRRWRQG